MRHRWYSPQLAQFMSHDPLEYIDSYNMYVFALMDPINFWDPWGLSGGNNTCDAECRQRQKDLIQSRTDNADCGGRLRLGCSSFGHTPGSGEDDPSVFNNKKQGYGFDGIRTMADIAVAESVMMFTMGPIDRVIGTLRVVRWAEASVGRLGSKALAQVCKNGRCQRLNPARLLKPCSFTEHTPVLMCDGSLKSIDEIEIGDWVLARSKETGELACREVMNLSFTAERSIILVTLESLDGTTEVIETTENHPFYVEGRGWTRVDELVPGDLVPSAVNGLLVVTALEWTDRIEVVYNFGVDEFHTYFVGEVGAWVHNCYDELKDKLGNMGKDEFERLTSRWSKGNHPNLQESLEYHADKHGSVDDIAKYLRQADAFTKKRALKKPLKDGAIRYEKDGKYLIERTERLFLTDHNDERLYLFVSIARWAFSKC